MLDEENDPVPNPAGRLPKNEHRPTKCHGEQEKNEKESLHADQKAQTPALKSPFRAGPDAVWKLPAGRLCQTHGVMGKMSRRAGTSRPTIGRVGPLDRPQSVASSTCFDAIMVLLGRAALGFDQGQEREARERRTQPAKGSPSGRTLREQSEAIPCPLGSPTSNDAIRGRVILGPGRVFAATPPLLFA